MRKSVLKRAEEFIRWTATTKRGQIITDKKLRSRYGKLAIPVLEGTHLIYEVDQKGKTRRFKILSRLPIKTDFEVLEKRHYTSTVESLFEDAFSEFELLLRDELQEWYGNLPENFQNGMKGEELQEAIDILEQIDRPDLPDIIKEVPVLFYPGKATSRARRCAEACSMLNAVIQAVEKTAPDFASDLAATVNAAEQVNFPGMY